MRSPFRTRSERHDERTHTADVLKGAIAGAAGVWAAERAPRDQASTVWPSETGGGA